MDISVRNHGRLAQLPFALAALGRQNVPRARVPRHNLAARSQLEPLGGAPMSLEFHLWQNYPPEVSCTAAGLG